MAVIPRKYDRRGPRSIEDYVEYMRDQIEQYATLSDARLKKCEALTATCAELTQKCAALEQKCAALQKQMEGQG